MLGNLSKLLIKTPARFINEQTNVFPNKSDLESYSTLNIKNRRNISHKYFRERDFWKSIKADINFNNNRRQVSPKVIKNPLISFEEFMLNSNIKKNPTLNTNSNIKRLTGLKNLKRNSYNFTPKTTNNGTNYIRLQEARYVSTSPDHKEKDEEYPSLLPMKTEHDTPYLRYINDRGSENNSRNGKNSMKEVFNINSFKNKKTDDENKYNDIDIENKNQKRILYENSNKINYIETDGNENAKDIKINESYTNVKDRTENLFGNWRFPKTSMLHRSQDTLYKENVDKKLGSLLTIKPTVKEQLESFNRNMVGQRHYLRFQKGYNMRNINPFYESIKYREGVKYLK